MVKDADQDEDQIEDQIEDHIEEQIGEQREDPTEDKDSIEDQEEDQTADTPLAKEGVTVTMLDLRTQINSFIFEFSTTIYQIIELKERLMRACG